MTMQQNNGDLTPKDRRWLDQPEYQIYVMGKIKVGSPWGPEVNAPQPVPAAIYQRMFDPVSTSNLDPAVGGLGIRTDKYIPTLPHNPLQGCHWTWGR
ncbi:hypothetical protein [Raineyella fluvialis]|uniref:Uncharacterized protein n=1 Tax=Raineyella fluvialis TaxID=2662261 RepID=A0A5Q2F751_9ACTN|nr:hypothetical protein [Raineyella fluvialis]QGF22822.1 hypothetical protein Rai3103_03085 [Raineyella fluvialis]